MHRIFLLFLISLCDIRLQLECWVWTTKLNNRLNELLQYRTLDIHKFNSCCRRQLARPLKMDVESFTFRSLLPWLHFSAKCAVIKENILFVLVY